MTRPIFSTSRPPSRERHLSLKRLKKGEEFVVRICSKQIFGYHSHWFKGHSHPCYNEQCECPSPLSEARREWHGVIHAFACVQQKDGFLELTDRCCEMLLDQVPNPDNLRGVRVTFRRSKGGDNGRLTCQVDQFAAIDRDLPSEQDPRKTLDVIWASKTPVDLLAFTG